MTIEGREKMAKMLAKEANLFATPIDFNQLIADGLLKIVGKSYYVDNVRKLPHHVATKIKTITQTRNGTRVTFYKESKSIQKLAEKTKHLFD